MRFVDRHSEFLVYEEALKLFIVTKKFSQTVKMIHQYQPAFTVEFLTFGLENDALDICFYLFYKYED
jgi:hypothetical protein